MADRWIKLYTDLLDWEWYDDPNTMRLFIHLLLTANWKDTRWHGIIIKRGQRVISRAGLAKELGLSEGCVKIALKHLKLDGSITSQRTGKVTVVTVENYEKWQGCSPAKVQKMDGKTSFTEPADDQKSAEDIEYIEYIESVEERETRARARTPSRARTVPPLKEWVTEYVASRGDVIDADYFYDYYQATDWQGVKDWQAKVRAWEKKEADRSGKAAKAVGVYRKFMEDDHD